MQGFPNAYVVSFNLNGKDLGINTKVVNVILDRVQSASYDNLMFIDMGLS